MLKKLTGNKAGKTAFWERKAQVICTEACIMVCEGMKTLYWDMRLQMDA
jgi:hypothetical protein